MNILSIILSFSLCLFSSFAISANVALNTRSEVITFIDEAATKHGLNKEELDLLFSKVESNPEIITRITTPFEKVAWDKYRALFLTKKRIQGGVKFWQQNAATLAKAEKQYGVPAELITAIIGVESFYGDHKGKYPVIEALSTLAFDYPPRANFFRNELLEFLLLSKEQQLDPFSIYGSYAGAMGIPQFISSCYRKYAVDFTQSGRLDLLNDMPTAIGSVANYFKAHGWKTQQQVLYPAKITGNKYKQLKFSDSSPTPNITIAEAKKFGLNPKVTKVSPNTKVAPIVFASEKGDKAWLGLHNFYVITRYNHSSQYAMAVYDLSKEIAAQHKKTKG